MKAFKIAAIGIGSLVGLLIVLMIAIPYFFKDKIVDAALQAANESLTARIVVDPSDVHFSLFSHFPNFTLAIEDFAIEGTGKFEGTTLIRASKIYAVIDLASVFSGTPNIRAVGLEKPQIHLITAKDGSANYDIVKPSDEKESEPADTSALALNIDLKKYSISRAEVDYIDSTSSMALHIGNLNHSGSGAMRSERFALKTETSIDTLTFALEGTRYIKDARILGHITLDMDMGAMVFTVDTQGEDYNLHLNDIDLLCEGSLGLLDGGGMDIDLHLGSGKTQFSSLLSMLPPQYASMLDGVKTEGTFEMDATVKGTYGENAFPAIQALLKAENGRIQYPKLPKSIDDIQIDLRVASPQSTSLDALTIDMSKCTMKVADSPVSATLQLATPISDPDIRASLKTTLDVASLRDVIPLEEDDRIDGKILADVSIAGRMSTLEKGNYQDFKADGSISIQNLEYATRSVAQPVRIPSAQLVFSPQALDLRSFALEIGESDLSLSGQLKNYLGYYLKGQTLQGNLNVSSKNLDLSSILPADSTATATPAAQEVAQSSPEETAASQPIRLPKGIRFDTQLDLKKVSYGTIALPGSGTPGPVRPDRLPEKHRHARSGRHGKRFGFLRRPPGGQCPGRHDLLALRARHPTDGRHVHQREDLGTDSLFGERTGQRLDRTQHPPGRSDAAGVHHDEQPGHPVHTRFAAEEQRIYQDAGKSPRDLRLGKRPEGGRPQPQLYHHRRPADRRPDFVQTGRHRSYPSRRYGPRRDDPRHDHRPEGAPYNAAPEHQPDDRQGRLDPLFPRGENLGGRNARHCRADHRGSYFAEILHRVRSGS